MKRPAWIRALALLLATVLLYGCSTTTPPTEPSTSTPTTTPTASPTTEPSTPTTAPHEHSYTTEVIAPTCTSEGYTIYSCACGHTYNDDYIEKAAHTYEETVIAPTTEAEGYTLYICTVCSYAYKDNYTDKLVEDTLTAAQKNSIAMLNYLATLTQEINSSRNSRMFLEEAYASLINNTNPEEVNELTESHLVSLLDTIEAYRLIAVQRERLAYIYNQNKAKAIQEAIPNPVSVLSAASSMDVKRLVLSVAYMAVDSVTSYNKYNDELDQAYLKDGWALDDQEANNLHESRKYAFRFMIEIVRNENLPGDLALNETAVEDFVKYTNNDNLHQRLQFLESSENTYRGFGNYWLALADCYYQLEEFEKCLNAMAMYEEYQVNIFRKDYYLAQSIPFAIAAAAEVYEGAEYIAFAEKYLELLVENTEPTEWTLRYIAAQIYVDLYTKTNDVAYLDEAYKLTKNNVNYLVDKQRELTEVYLADIKDATIPNDATNEEKERIKKHNDAMREARKTELPPVYEPLLLNCELLFALIDKIDVPASEKTSIEAILGINSSDVFLTEPLINRYDFTPHQINVTGTYDRALLKLPVSCLSADSVIRVSVTEGGVTTVHEDWRVTEVKRTEEGFDAYMATFSSESAKTQKWSADSTVLVEIFDAANSEYEPIVLQFKVKNYTVFILEFIEFEQVS